MDQFRIALLSSHSCPWAKPGNRYTGGMNIYIQNLARELAHRGHMVDIYTASHIGDEKCVAVELEKGVRLIHINSADYSFLSEVNLDNNVSDFTESILSYCNDFDRSYDVIHSHYWLSGLIGNKLGQRWKIPHITMFHTLARLKNKAGISTLEPDFRIGCEKKIIDTCDMIIASTEKEKGELVHEYTADPKHISVIPCGIDPVLFRPVDKAFARKACNLASKKTILFVGRMDPLKGLSNLLEAISILQPRNDFQLLVIGGDGKNETEYQRMLDLIRENNISSMVIPLGSIPHEDMYLYYNAADFCIIPSYYESFSLVALESLSCGTPILSTDVGEVRDMIKMCEDCRITDDNSPVTLAGHIDDMLRRNNDHKYACQSMLTTRYGWNTITEKILSVYNQVVSSDIESERSILHI